MLKPFVILLTCLGLCQLYGQVNELPQTNLAGVYQGKTLFIQNPYNAEKKSYCVEQILINNEPLLLNYKLSAIMLDFEGYDLYTPVNISIVHSDSVCKPIIINSEAILFHTIFRFSSVALTDSLLLWETKGERGVGSFEIEKLENGIWVLQNQIKASGIYEGASYTYSPSMDEGPNKYRIKYNYPIGSRSNYLYSMEMDHDYYPDPVEFKPKSAKTRIYLSRFSPYEIYNEKSELVLTGEGSEIDVTILRQGRYAIYFDGKDPGTFVKE